MSGARVLIVEDSEVAGQTLKLVLSTAGYDVKWETTGAAALATVNAWKPQVVLVDRGLPDTDGDEVATQITDARVIVLSGEARPPTAGHTGAWLVKPVTNRELLAAVGGATT